MRLSLTTCHPLFEELLLLLQPLSLLTFNLDLLFQHHHLEPDGRGPEIPSPPSQDTVFQLSSERSHSNNIGSRYIESLSEVDFGSSELQAAKDNSSPLAGPRSGGAGESTYSTAAPIKESVTLGQTSPQLLWVQEKEIGALPPPNIEEDSLAQQAGQVLIFVGSCSVVVVEYVSDSTGLAFFIIGDPAGMGGCNALGRQTEPEPG